MGSWLSINIAEKYPEVVIRILLLESESHIPETQNKIIQFRDIEQKMWNNIDYNNPEFFNVSKYLSFYENMNLNTVENELRTEILFIRDNLQKYQQMNFNDEILPKLQKYFCLVHRLLIIHDTSDNTIKKQIYQFIKSKL
jgi:hypothetical protein